MRPVAAAIVGAVAEAFEDRGSDGDESVQSVERRDIGHEVNPERVIHAAQSGTAASEVTEPAAAVAGA